MDGILFKGEKIIVPHTLREDMLARIHTGHMGIEKCKQRARDVLFWPGMGKQIEAIVGSCSTCLERRNSNPKEPMISHQIPDRPWQTVATDLFTLHGEDYIVTVDYHSRFIEVDRLRSTTTSAVIHKLKALFARLGIPETVVSDNGPCYSSSEFRRFAQDWDFNHVTSSPTYPQSNGLAEKAVQTAKSLLEKAKMDKKDPYLSLLEYRNAPVDGLKSPAQLLMSRRLRSILPTTSQQLRPQVACQSTVYARRKLCQQRQKQYYDRTARPLSTLRDGATVHFQQSDGHWKPATVIQSADAERSYHIRTPEGQEYRRNRRHLLQAKESDMNIQPTTTEDVDTQLQQPEAHESPTRGSGEQSQCLTTRSGRAVKPRVRLDL